MSKKYTVIRKELAEAKIGHTIPAQIPGLDLGNFIPRELRVVHVGIHGSTMTLLNDNDSIVYTVRVRSADYYTIRSVGQMHEKEIMCASGDHGIHIVAGQLSLASVERRHPVEVGDILKGTVTDDDYEVRFVEGKVLVTKHVQTGTLYSYDNPTHAKVNYKTMEFEA